MLRQVLESLLKSWRKDPTNKVLIFTKSVKLLEMLDFHLQSQSNHCPHPDINARFHRIFFSTDLGFLKLDGSTKQSESTLDLAFQSYFFLLTAFNSSTFMIPSSLVRHLPFLACTPDVPTIAMTGLPMIDQFHSSPNIFIFLISTLAGGTGLNLTGANKVVIFG